MARKMGIFSLLKANLLDEKLLYVVVCDVFRALYIQDKTNTKIKKYEKKAKMVLSFLKL